MVGGCGIVVVVVKSFSCKTPTVGLRLGWGFDKMDFLLLWLAVTVSPYIKMVTLKFSFVLASSALVDKFLFKLKLN